ncbi:MAG TPA: family 78 glycoside hydrolase catalytic domain [Asanoa sp.]
MDGILASIPGEFSRSFFRRTFELAEVPHEAAARLTADSRYVLWVNGREVGRGPARSQPSRLRYDTYDLAPHLVTGRNVVAVLVTYYGRPNSFWMPPAGSGGVGGDAVLVFEALLGEVELVSDGRWRSRRSTAWSVPPDTRGIRGVPVEILDARELPHGWQRRDFDDSDWSQAAVRAAIHMGGLARSRPPTFPFGRLQPRGISQLSGDRVAPAAVLDSSSRPGPKWTGEDPVSRVTQVLLEPSTGSADTQLPATFTVGPRRVHHVGVDFGRIVAGFVELDVRAPAGTVVELQYREKAFRPETGAAESDPETGARYIARGSDDSFTACEINGLRYVHLVVHAERDATVTIDRLAVREYLYPWAGGAYFRSDDPVLNAIYRAGVRTVRLNSFDASTDCPTREQRAWVGDGVVHQLVHLTTNADWGLARNYLELSDSPRPDGMLPMSVAGEMEASGGLTIPDWALSWVHGVHEQYRYEGDVERVRKHLPTVERVLRWYADYADDRGTINDVPEWSLVDWSSIFLTGRSSILTALWARGLQEYTALSEAVGNSGSADWARGLYTAAARGYEDFWDADRGLYVDHILDGERMPAASQAANAAAVISGLAPAPRWGAIVDAMTDPDRVVVRSWIGSETGGYDMQKAADQARGIQRIAWDADREIVSAEPFFSYAVHDAVARADRAVRLIELVRRWGQFLVDGYDTFGECWGWGTPVHGWSCTPTRDLVAYVLGITPDEPGYARVRIAPRLGPLREAAGAVPTPHGPVEVRISGAEAEIDSPVPARLVRDDGSRVELEAGTHRVTVR